MKLKIILLLVSVCPVFVFSQSYISADSANKIIMNGGDCDHRTFTRIETLPSIKISKQAFIDSISLYLKSNGTSLGDGTIKLLFVVDCHSKISNIQKLSGNISDAATLKAAVLKFSDFWLPGRQNNYIASSYVRLEMEFKNDILNNITIAQ
jgi:hypothetical protein